MNALMALSGGWWVHTWVLQWHSFISFNFANYANYFLGEVNLAGQELRTPAVACFITSPLFLAPHTTLLLQYQIISLFSFLTFYAVTALLTHLCLPEYLNLSRSAVNCAIYTHLYKHTHKTSTASVTSNIFDTGKMKGYRNINFSLYY